MRPNSRIFALSTLVAATLCASAAPAFPATSLPELRLEVASVRKMPAAEIKKRAPPDLLGLDVAVRLRLSTGGSGVWFLVSDNPLVVEPRGHAVSFEGGRILWRFGGTQGEKADESPGISRLATVRPTSWILLPSHASLEWEVLDSSSKNPESRGFTIFAKRNATDPPEEIVSEPFEALLRTSEWP